MGHGHLGIGTSQPGARSSALVDARGRRVRRTVLAAGARRSPPSTNGSGRSSTKIEEIQSRDGRIRRRCSSELDAVDPAVPRERRSCARARGDRACAAGRAREQRALLARAGAAALAAHRERGSARQRRRGLGSRAGAADAGRRHPDDLQAGAVLRRWPTARWTSSSACSTGETPPQVTRLFLQGVADAATG